MISREKLSKKKIGEKNSRKCWGFVKIEFLDNNLTFRIVCERRFCCTKCISKAVEKRRENDSRRIYTHHQSPQWVLLLFLGWCWTRRSQEAGKLKLQNVGEELLPSESHGDHYYGAVDELCSSPYPPPPKHWTLFWQIANQVPNWIRNPNQWMRLNFSLFYVLPPPNDCVDSRFREFLIRVTGIFRFRSFLKNSNTYPKHRQKHFLTGTLIMYWMENSSLTGH